MSLKLGSRRFKETVRILETLKDYVWLFQEEVKSCEGVLPQTLVNLSMFNLGNK